jgi:hypothetical protein
MFTHLKMRKTVSLVITLSAIEPLLLSLGRTTIETISAISTRKTLDLLRARKRWIESNGLQLKRFGLQNGKFHQNIGDVLSVSLSIISLMMAGNVSHAKLVVSRSVKTRG